MRKQTKKTDNFPYLIIESETGLTTEGEQSIMFGCRGINS
jgi:hypothetical protein